MFTSEHWRRLRETSRPPLAFRASLSLAFLPTLPVCTRMVEVWTSDQSPRAPAINARRPEPRVSSAGASHVFATLDPAFIRTLSINLAAPVGGHVCVEGIVRESLAKVPHRQALVIEDVDLPGGFAHRGLGSATSQLGQAAERNASVTFH